MERKYALLMNMPDNKLPGFYAQIVKALANKAPLFDRDKEMLIFSAEPDREAAIGIMQQYKIEHETLELLLLPAGTEMAPTFSDFGFVSRAEHIYVYAEQAALFRLVEIAGGEPAQALQQMDEHLLARCVIDGVPAYAVETHLLELMEGIAKAYGCGVEVIS
ncbi:hypothetical protein [Paenibacillus hamazuiensis]|uniref:hypothetical protein n=1 Tax=Paenibacillus hamazuiensis TaxID=2936508 RepID=UPI00200F8998|nr:hypothetical protein [Paenibacillus hamazuiensis]